MTRLVLALLLLALPAAAQQSQLDPDQLFLMLGRCGFQAERLQAALIAARQEIEKLKAAIPPPPVPAAPGT